VPSHFKRGLTKICRP